MRVGVAVYTCPGTEKGIIDDVVQRNGAGFHDFLCQALDVAFLVHLPPFRDKYAGTHARTHARLAERVV